MSHYLPSLYYLETIIHFCKENVYKQKWTKYAQNDTLKWMQFYPQTNIDCLQSDISLSKGGLKMYINSGYHNHSLIDFKDKSRPLIVGRFECYAWQDNAGKDILHSGISSYEWSSGASGKIGSFSAVKRRVEVSVL